MPKQSHIPNHVDRRHLDSANDGWVVLQLRERARAQQMSIDARLGFAVEFTS